MSEIEIVMKDKDNDRGVKSCYCWEGSVFHIATVAGWQEIIYGKYKYKGEKPEPNLGIKRNGEITGRSACFYQVVKPPLSFSILSCIEQELRESGHLKKIAGIRKELKEIGYGE